jgi:ornithine--oxo-acid transaminase
VSAREVCLLLLEEGILAKDTHENVIRLAPPLIVAEADLLHAADTVSRVLVRVATAARFPHARTG